MLDPKHDPFSDPLKADFAEAQAELDAGSASRGREAIAEVEAAAQQRLARRAVADKSRKRKESSRLTLANRRCATDYLDLSDADRPRDDHEGVRDLLRSGCWRFRQTSTSVPSAFESRSAESVVTPRLP